MKEKRIIYFGLNIASCGSALGQDFMLELTLHLMVNGHPWFTCQHLLSIYLMLNSCDYIITYD